MIHNKNKDSFKINGELLYITLVSGVGKISYNEQVINTNLNHNHNLDLELYIMTHFVS
jgi:hypothetical protein